MREREREREEQVSSLAIKRPHRWPHIGHRAYHWLIGSYATSLRPLSSHKLKDRARGRTLPSARFYKSTFLSLSFSLSFLFLFFTHSPSLTPVVTQMQVLPVLWLIAFLTDIATSSADSIASKQLVLDPSRLCKRTRRLKGNPSKTKLFRPKVFHVFIHLLPHSIFSSFSPSM